MLYRNVVAFKPVSPTDDKTKLPLISSTVISSEYLQIPVYFEPYLVYELRGTVHPRVLFRIAPSSVLSGVVSIECSVDCSKLLSKLMSTVSKLCIRACKRFREKAGGSRV